MIFFFRHFLFLILSLAAVVIQMNYRVPGGWEFLLFSLLSFVLVISVFFILIQDFVWGRNSDVVRNSLVMGKIAQLILIVILGYSLVLLCNGIFDRSERIPYSTKIVKIISEEIVIGGTISLGWVEIEPWDQNKKKSLKVIINPREVHRLWEGQEVVVFIRHGFFSIPWVAGIELNKEKYSAQILAQFPKAAEVRKDLIYYFLDNRFMAKAHQATLEYLVYYPDDYDFVQGVAAEFGQRRMHTEVVAILEKFLGKKEDYNFYNLLGWALAHIGQQERGIELIKKSMALAPKSFWAYYHLGYIYRDLGKWQEAREMFGKVLELRKNFPEIQAEMQKISQ